MDGENDVNRYYVIAIAASTKDPGNNTPTRDTTVVAMDPADAVRQVAYQLETNIALMETEPKADTFIIAAVPSELADELIRKLTN